MRFFMSSADILKSSFFRKILRISNSLDSNPVRHFDVYDLGPNCLQILSAGDTSRQRLKTVQNYCCANQE